MYKNSEKCRMVEFMNMESYLLEKLSKVLFLEIKEGSKINDFKFEENTFLPVRGDEIIDKTKAGDDLKNIPVNMFIEGMIYVLGADKNFRFNDTYKNLIKHIQNSDKFIKGVIFKHIKEEKYEDGYIMLRGLLEIQPTEDIFDKALLLVDGLRSRDSKFKEEELALIEKAKEIGSYTKPYYYEALIKRDEKDFQGALFSINQYLSQGGELNEEVSEIKASLITVTEYDKAKEIVYDAPKEALQIFIPLLDTLGDSAEIYYFIAVAYRILENHEKAIYYLNEALVVSSDYIEVVNELGINYACLGNYDFAIKYFRKAFEVTKSIEICTNLIMCYINTNDLKQAKLHLEIAKKIDPKDEIVLELEEILSRNTK
jgi:tetratricopeptide (TPR) repeat protein